MSRLGPTGTLFVVLAVMVLGFACASSSFYQIYNIKLMLANIAFTGIVAATLTLIMISGGLDISIGGSIALTTCFVAWLHNLPNPPSAWIIVIAALLLGTVIGTVNGLLITGLNLDPIITTIGTMAITRGLAYVLTDGQSILVLDEITEFIGQGEIVHIPVPVLLFGAVYLVLTVTLTRSGFGRRVYCIGANPVTAELSGIRVNRVRFVLYLLSGIAASISGLILLGQSLVGMPQHALGSELNVITAVLIGGVPLTGGRGTVMGTLAGVLILGVLYNGFTIMGFGFVHISIFQGIFLIVAVALYTVRNEAT